MDTTSEWHGEWVPHEVARQIEHELKDARQIASKYEDRYFATRELLNVSTERAETLERELAAANERVKRLEEAGDELSRHASDQARDDWNQAKEATR